MEDRDIRGYQDVEKLCTRMGQPRMLEDEQLAVAEVCTAEEQMGTVVDDNDDVASIDLMGKKRTKRDGMGQT